VIAHDVALPPLQIDKLPSGLTLLAVQKRGLPLFHVRLSLPAGACEDPRGKAGLAQFTVELLRRGTRRRPPQDVDEMIESMGAQLYSDVSMEEAALALTVPAELTERALDALLEVALEPAFEEAEVAAARRRTLAALQSELDEPSTVAGRALVSLGYGPGHPYAHPAQGFRRDVDTFQREDALSFHATRYQQQGALLAAVGQSTPTELIDLLGPAAASAERCSSRRWRPRSPAAPSSSTSRMRRKRRCASSLQGCRGRRRGTRRRWSRIPSSAAASPLFWSTPSAWIAGFPTRYRRGCT